MIATRFRVTRIVLAAAISFGSAACSAQDSAPAVISHRMPDGREWAAENLSIVVAESYCYEDAPRNCRRYGRLYTWQSAQQACRLLGEGWRLPSDNDWRQLAGHFGGAYDESPGSGRTAYEALLSGGGSGFAALLGGGRASADGRYDDLGAHGFYWTASQSDPAIAWFYNFARGGAVLYRQRDGEQLLALSVRCIRE